MAKHRASRRRATADEEPTGRAVVPAEQLVPGQAGPVEGLSLLAVTLRHLVYTEIEVSDPPNPAPEDASYLQVKLAGEIRTGDGDLAEAVIHLVLIPDVRQRPIRIEATMSALIRHSAGMSAHDATLFLNHNGGRLLFPYVRELVSNITARGIYDAVNLDPWVLGPLVPDDQLGVRAPR